MVVKINPLKVVGRVLMIVENLPVPFDRRVWQEAIALREAGYEVSIICPKGRGHNLSEETLEGIQIYRHPLPLEASGPVGFFFEYSTALFYQFFLSCRVLRRHGFDLIHACNPPDLIFLVALFHKIIFRKKFLFDQHDICPELYEVKFKRKGLVHRLLQFLERCTFRVADGSIATSAMLKERAVVSGKMSPDKVWIVRSFPDLNRFKRIVAEETFKIFQKQIVGYVGIMAEQDGVELLVRAMHHVVTKLGRNDVFCLIVGDGPDYERLRTLATELVLDRHVKFTGYLAGDALLSAISAFDIGVIPDPPNVCNDKLSMNKVFEYMAFGLPFVQFDLPQASIDAGDAALIVKKQTPEDLAHGIVDLLDDKVRLARMSAYAIKRARRDFQWTVEKHRLLEAYRTLLPLEISRNGGRNVASDAKQ